MNMADQRRAAFIDAVSRTAEIMERDNPKLDMSNWTSCVCGHLMRRGDTSLAIAFRHEAVQKNSPQHDDALRLFSGNTYNLMCIRNGRDWADMARGWLHEQSRITA